jgi:hypothetical protein
MRNVSVGWIEESNYSATYDLHEYRMPDGSPIPDDLDMDSQDGHALLYHLICNDDRDNFDSVDDRSIVSVEDRFVFAATIHPEGNPE